MGGTRRFEGPLPGHRVRPARVVLPRRPRSPARAHDRPGLLSAHGRHRALALPGCPEARRAPAERTGLRGHTPAPPVWALGPGLWLRPRTPPHGRPAIE